MLLFAGYYTSATLEWVIRPGDYKPAKGTNTNSVSWVFKQKLG